MKGSAGEAARQVLGSVASNTAAAQESVWRFLEGQDFWSVVPALWQLDAMWCSVAVARRCRWRPDAEAVRGTASLPACSGAISRQLGVARAHLLLAGLPLVGTADEALLEAVAGLSPSPSLVRQLAGSAHSLVASSAGTRAARAWLPLLLQARPQLPLEGLAGSDVLLDVLGTLATPASHPALFAAFHLQPRLSPELCVAASLATTPPLRLLLLPRVCALLCAGHVPALSVVPLVSEPVAALVALLQALLEGVAQHAQDKEARREAQTCFLHLYSHAGAQAYGNVLLSSLERQQQLSAAQLASLWYAAWPVSNAQLARLLLARAWATSAAVEPVATFVGRAALCDETEETLARSVEWLVRARSKAAAKAMALLCAECPRRLAAHLPQLMQQQRVFVLAIARLTLCCGRLDVYDSMLELVVAAGDARALVHLTSGNEQQMRPVAGLLAQWWPRIVAVFGQQALFWKVCDALLGSLGQLYGGTLAQGTLAAIQSCKKGQLEQSLTTFALLIQEFNSATFWHDALAAVCQHVLQQDSPDSGLLTVFFQIMLQPLFYTPELVLGSRAVLGALFGLAHKAVALPDVELLRAVAQLSEVLLGERAGESGEWRRAAMQQFGGSELAEAAWRHLLDTRHSVAIEHLSTLMRMLMRAGAQPSVSLSRLTAEQSGTVAARLRAMAAHARGGELFGRYAQLCSDVQHGVEPRNKLLQ